MQDALTDGVLTAARPKRKGQPDLADLCSLTSVLCLFGLLGLVGFDQTVLVRVEFLEHVPRAEELFPRQVAVLVPTAFRHSAATGPFGLSRSSPP